MADADLTPEQRATAELLARYNDEIRRFGAASPETRAAIAAGGEKTAKRLDFYAQSASAALGGLAAGASSVVKALYSGETGMKQFDGMIDGVGKAAGEASKALQVAGGPIGKVAAVVLKFVELLTGPAKAVNELADKYYTSYQQLARSGAAAADGMMGVGNDALKMGLVLKDMDGYVQLISSNAPELARFGGSAARGRQMLADMGQELERDRTNFIALGMDMKDVGEGMVGFVKQQNLSGGVSTRNTKELAQSARAYILEQDAITKLTGVSRKDMEEQHASAMREEQYNALLRKVRQEQGDEAADAIINTRKMIENTVGPQAAKGFAASMTGNLADPEARRFALTAGTDTINALQGLKTGLIDPIQAVGLVGKGLKRFEGSVGNSLGLIGANNSTFLAYHEQVKAGLIDESKLRDELEKIKKLQADALKEGNKETAQQAKTRAEQLEFAITAQKGMQLMVAPMQASALKLTEIIGDLVDGLTTLVNWFFKKPNIKPPPSVEEAKKTAEDLTKQAADLQTRITKGEATAEDVQKFNKLSAQAAQAGAQVQASKENEKRLVSLKKQEMARKGTPITREQALEMVKSEQVENEKKQAEKQKGGAGSAPGAGGASASAAAAPATPTSPAPGGGAESTTAKATPTAPGGGAAAPATTKQAAPAASTARGAPAAAPAAPAESAAGTPANVKFGPDANLAGVDQTLLDSFNQFAREFGQSISINSAYRDDKKQAELWVRANVFKDPNIYAPTLPRNPTTITYRGQTYNVEGGGNSKHNVGSALDISAAGIGKTKGPVDDLLAKFGLHRPHLPKDPPHIQFMADGGITRGPSIVGEAGAEAVIPLKSGSVPVDLGTVGEALTKLKPLINSEKTTKDQDSDMTQVVEKAIRGLAAQLSKPKPIQEEMLEMLRDIKRANDDTADISAKIARTAMN